MRTPLRLAVAQPPCVAYDVAANAAHHAAAVRAAGARVVVFPELSLTGYELDAPVVDEHDPRLAELVAACTDTGTLALAGAPVRGDHIATLAVDGAGVRVAYRKMFLGGVEPGRFRPSGVPAVLVVDDWRLGLAICKDTGIPEQTARTAALGMDVLVASLVDTACDAPVQDERAYRIATTHRVHVAMASCAASTGGGFGEPAARSAVWSPAGLVLARAGTTAGEVVGAILEP